MRFEELNIVTPIMEAIKTEGYEAPTPIQEQAIPAILAGRDLLGCAQTGTGKTAAFAIPMLQILNGEMIERKDQCTIKALVLAPTRELAVQIGESLSAYGRYLRIRHAVIFGGVSQVPQTKELGAGIDILVATPGRLLDLMGQGYIKLDHIKFFVLDEADRMLDMGFLHDVKKIMAKLPAAKQTLLFSATMPHEIKSMADNILSNPVMLEVTPVSSTVDTIDQSVYFVEKRDKKALLIKLLRNKSVDSVLVFTRTKHGADNVVRNLAKARITAQAIHGDKSQVARQNALSNFKSKRTRVLVATDIAARGIDVKELSCVINFDLPNIPETYVHRVGRTGRAGMGGTALSFCDNEEKAYLRDIQRLISREIPVIEDQPC
ncbi:MAG TPA: DEAD/DEAH box helicase [Clostridia bacterium]|nr:DEAD/DEAH box helicase [Clostridia bacterium]